MLVAEWMAQWWAEWRVQWWVEGWLGPPAVSGGGGSPPVSGGGVSVCGQQEGQKMGCDAMECVAIDAIGASLCECCQQS